MDVVYRVRPANEFTIAELKEPYLWFSRPVGFKGDRNDANICAFINDTGAIRLGIEHSLPEFPYESFYKQMGHTGICCFTSELPDNERIKGFRKCSKRNCVCVEYDKHKLEEFFKNHKSTPIHPCFIPVVYDDNPTELDTYDKWSFQWSEDQDGKQYKTIPGILQGHPRDRDVFIQKLFSRISYRFKDQKEIRIILGGCNIPSHDENLLGYRIPIPEYAINRVILYPNVQKDYEEQLNEIASIKGKINHITV